jgi:predicted O-methyltransferase YrrM
MDFTSLAVTLEGIQNMTPANGRLVYDHLEQAGARDVLEIGTAHGVSSAYMAGSVMKRGGRVTTVDHVVATRLRDPQPGDVHERAGVADVVDRVLVEDSSYNWWLMETVAKQSDTAGNVEPLYDFCYLDGAHHWTIDGLAVVLIEKLLRPGGWLLLDDLDWSYGDPTRSFGPGQGPKDLGLSDSEMSKPHMQLVFDLIVRQHPSFTEFRIEDGAWGWAHKLPGAPRTLTVAETSQPLADQARLVLRKGVKATAQRLQKR